MLEANAVVGVGRSKRGRLSVFLTQTAASTTSTHSIRPTFHFTVHSLLLFLECAECTAELQAFCCTFLPSSTDLIAMAKKRTSKFVKPFSFISDVG